MSSSTKVYDRGKHLFRSENYLNSRFHYDTKTRMTNQSRDVKLSELLSEFKIRLNESDSKSKCSCQKCVRQTQLHISLLVFCYLNSQLVYSDNLLFSECFQRTDHDNMASFAAVRLMFSSKRSPVTS